MTKLTAVILAGGLGTRLRPFTYAVPKPLVPIGERPVLEILIGALAGSGVDRIRLCLGYMAPLVIAFIQSRGDWQCGIDFVIEAEPLGTAAPLRLVADLPEDFLVVNGDTLTNLDFHALHRFHRERGAAITIFSPQVEERVDYGLLEIEPGSERIVRYLEKPLRTLDVSSGIYAISRDVLRYLPDSGRFDMPDLVRRAINGGELVTAFRSPGVYWRDIGRQDHLDAANREMRDSPERFA
jgi:NDP-sugar pyrophosphorylase family protein